MWLMLQERKPDDYVVGTGETYSIKYFAEKAFDTLGLNFQKYNDRNSLFVERRGPSILSKNSNFSNRLIGYRKSNFYL